MAPDPLPAISILRIPRNVKTELTEPSGGAEQQVLPISKFRECKAWALLGEPGAGKSVVLADEAEAIGTQVIRAEEFAAGLKPQGYSLGTPVFIDALDEVRIGPGGGILQQIRSCLQELGNPPFRISCRAFDWYGAADRTDLERSSPDQTLTVLFLEELSSADIKQLLSTNHGVANPEELIERVSALGLSSLLRNPQNLAMVAKASRAGHLPKSKAEVFNFACLGLVDESNDLRARRHDTKISSAKRLEAAGNLCAVLLLSNQNGIARSSSARTDRFPTLDELEPIDSSDSEAALQSRLFKNEGEDYLIPIHRSVAEFLGAKWLASQIDSRGLPSARVIGLLAGQDGRAVSGLKGLYGWLSSTCVELRDRLVTLDPWAVIGYGDPSNLPLTGKRVLLKSLQVELARNPGARWRAENRKLFKSLRLEGLESDFLKILHAGGVDDASQATAAVVLELLGISDEPPRQAFSDDLLALVQDDRVWMANRIDALRLWLRCRGNLKAAISLTRKVRSQSVIDDRHELLGILLEYLYPEHISTEFLLKHLVIPDPLNGSTSYHFRIEYELPNKVPDDQIENLLDGLISIDPSDENDFSEDGLGRLKGTLLLRVLQRSGCDTPPAKLLQWLQATKPSSGHRIFGQEVWEQIASWFEESPEVYLRVLGEILKNAKASDNPSYWIHKNQQLMGCRSVPVGLGKWLLDRITSEPDGKFRDAVLSQALSLVSSGSQKDPFTLEDVFEWANKEPSRIGSLNKHLVCDLTPFIEARNFRRTHRKESEAEARERSRTQVREQFHAIRTGTASIGWYFHLALIWTGNIAGAVGSNPQERFERWFGPDEGLVGAVQSGLPSIFGRSEVPSSSQILSLHVKQGRWYNAGFAFLLALDLEWEKGRSVFSRISDQTCIKGLMFFLCQGTGEFDRWVLELATERPDLFSTVYIEYALAALSGKVGLVHGLDWICRHENTFHGRLSIISSLLAKYPPKADGNSLHQLKMLLLAAIESRELELGGMARSRVLLPANRTSPGQKAIWLVVRHELERTASTRRSLVRYIQQDLHLAIVSAEFYLSLKKQKHDLWAPVPELIEEFVLCLIPSADFDFHTGVVSHTPSREAADLVRALVSVLSATISEEGEEAMQRLLGNAATKKIHFILSQAQEDQRNRIRDQRFAFPTPAKASRTLRNSEPTSVKDLFEMTKEALHSIEVDIRTGNDDGFRAFWNLEGLERGSKRPENICRDQVLLRLRTKLGPHGISCDPEFDYFNDKRADIRVSFKNEMAIPIEFKRDDHPELLTTVPNQLAPRYLIDPLCEGYGVLVVFWFGIGRIRRGPLKPKEIWTTERLTNYLQSGLSSREAERINIRVLDVSWPS